MKKYYAVFTLLTLLLLGQWAHAQSITVTAPVPGSSLFGCTTQNITWTFTGLGSSVFNIQYSPDNGANWVTVGSNYNSPGGTFTWTLPNISSPFFLVRVESVSNPGVFDVTDAVFSVNGALLVSSPNGGEGWATGTSQPITWAQNGTSGTYRIEYSTNNGLSWLMINSSYSTAGNSYPWTIPNTPSNQCLVRVADVADPTCKLDVSNGVFSILSSIQVTAPNTALTWQATVGPQNTQVNMDNVTVTANTGNFYDNGGSGGNYSIISSLTKTFYPDVSTNKLQFVFTAMSLGSGHTLTVYNGPNTGSPVLATITGTTIPGTLTSTHSTGALTFAFTAPSGSPSTGWESYFRSIGTPTQNITWSIVGTSGKYHLDYSTDNGLSWNAIVKGYPSSTGTFAWSVPNTPSTNCLIRVTDQGNSAVVDQSNATFTIGQATPIVISPNGGENWWPGNNQNITWVPVLFLSANVKIELTTDNGATWSTLSASWPNSSGAFPWNVPNTPSNQCRVRVSDPGNAASNDQSNGLFTINPHIRVTTPNGGNNLVGCGTQNISFQHGGTSGAVKIELSTDNGTTWTSIVNSFGVSGNSATYTSWQVPNVNSNQCLIRVSDASDPLKVDVSDAVFTINQTTNVLVLTPNGGENWVAGTAQNITYTIGGGVTMVEIDYSSNNGTSWSNLASGHTGGSYNWIVPNNPGTNNLIRIYDSNNGCNLDISNATFTITSTLTVTAPNGGESWNATVGVQGIAYNMDNVTTFTNTAMFYDNGGPSGNLSLSNLIKTVYPDNPLNKLRVRFLNRNMTAATVTVHNGPSTASPVLGTISGTATTTTTFTSTDVTGALTFSLAGTTGGTGWEGYFESVGTPTQNINWNIVGTSGKFKLDYTTNNGTSWINILNNYPSTTGTFAWQVPNTPSANCKVRVSDASLGTIVDESNNVFTIGPVTPVVLLYTPNNNINAFAGNTTTISWRTGFITCPTVDLEYSTDAGATWTLIAANVPNSTSVGNYVWTVPNTPSTTCRVRVKDSCVPATNDISDLNFTIRPHITISTPNGGEALTGCNLQNISFQHGGTSGTVKIELSTDNGTTWTSIINNFAVTGSSATYTNWQVPNTNASQCLIRVSDAADPLKVDVSNAPFSISQTSNVLVITPNGGENWVTGTTQNITYSVGGGVSMVEIDYSTNNGTSWINLASGHTGGVYAWVVPNTPGINNLVRIYDSNNFCNLDISNANFTITSTLTVTAPNGGESWNATVGTQGIAYNMDNVPVFTNTAMFYDNGGPTGNLTSTNLIKTVYPDNPLNKLRVRFLNRNMTAATVTVHNGPSTASPILGTVSGTATTTTTFTSTDITGALTFALAGTTGGTGWEGYFESVGTPTQNINWNIVGTSGRFKLDYTTNNGSSWINILNNYPSTTGTFAWQVPNTPSPNCKVRVSDAQLGTIVDESNNVFTIGPVTPVVVLYTPNNNINAFAGTTTTISWRTGFISCPTVDLEYSTDAGVTWTLIAANVPNSTSVGNYIWTVPNTPSTTCRVRVKDSCVPATSDISDLNFTIRPHLTISTPNGGESLSGCNIQNISFQHGGTSGTVKIELSTDNGTTWTSIINNFAVTGSSATYTNWQVPNINASQCLIRVSDAADPLKVDVSNAPFSISQTSNVLVITPNGGENWVTGTTQNITYSLGGGVTMVEIDFSSNNGTSWSNLVSGHTGGVYNWTVPNTPGTNNLIRIYDSNNFCNLDISNATFTITSTLTVTAPNGGESWNATVGTQGIAYNMDNVPVFTNTAMFYDNGGPTGNLTISNLTKTVYPDNPLNKLRVRFLNRNMSAATLTVHNGPTTAFPILGTISGTASTTTTFTSTESTGALTFALAGTTGGTGWEGYFESVGTPTQNINWNIVGTSGRFKLDYTTNNGTSWINILNNYPSTTGTYAWQVPNTPSANCKVRVSDATLGTIVDESNNVFTIGPVTPVVVLYTPNNNINAFAGTTTTISWRTGFIACPTVDLEYSTDAGATWILIAANVPNSTSVGNYVWTVPNTPSTTCRVRVKDSCVPATNDISDLNFTIRPHLTIITPNGGEALTGCNIQNISFQHGGTSGTVKIELSTDNGTTWTSIINSFAVTGSSGTYTNWQVPNTNAAQCLIRVSDAADPLKVDVSNAPFSISQTTNVLVVTPNGGENFVAGTTQPVTYTIGGGVSMVEIDYSTNNGTSWINLVSGHTGGVYNWTVPNNPGINNLIRIYDSNNFCNLDISNATFTITSTLTVTAPNGGESWNATVGPQGIAYNMDNVPVFTNTAMFYDNGGPTGNLTSTNLIKTVYPDNPLNKLRVRFLNRNMTAATLTVHNGPTTAFPVLGTISGTASTSTTFTSTDITGALTFSLAGTTGGTGWEGYFESVGTPTQNITWNIVGTSGRFKLDYTTNNGTSWINILNNYPSTTGTYAWQVPNTPSANCKVRVSDATLGTIVDESNNVFTIGPVTPVIMVYTPNGGESPYPSQTQTVSWRTGFISCPTVDLEYSTDAGTTWQTIAVNVPNSTSTGSYPWTVPNTPSNTCRVRVKDSCVPTTNDISNSNFVIRAPITVTSPNGGENLSGCNLQNITFQHGGTSGNVRIDYTTNNGVSWLPIVANFAVTGNSATYTGWQLPNTNLPPVKVRVRDVLDTLKTDESNNTFNISQSSHVIVFAPNGNENWITGTTQQVQFVLSGGVTSVELDYSTNNGTNWISIGSGVTGTSYNWVIPNTPSTVCKVRAIDSNNGCKIDVSDSTFTITSTVAVTYPNGGEVLTSYVGPQGNTHNMDNVPITLNTGNFYDNGGPTGNFTAGGFVKTFTPDYPTNKLRVSFVTRNMGSGTLTVYNGPNTGGTVLGTVSGSGNTLQVFTSTHATGALTFAVGGTPGGTGWEAYLQSIGTPTQNITWNITGTSQVYNLDYSTNNGANWVRIVRNYPSTTGTFPWQIPNTLTSQALVRVQDFNNNAIVDQSNNTFTIGAPTPTLITPNGGQVYYSGQTQTIVWANTTFLTTNVRLEYSTNNGSSWIMIDPNAPNIGSYSWVIPNTLIALPTCLVRVSDVNSTFLNDVSDNVFAIRPPIRITSPNGPSGASTWQACALSSITWDAGISSNYKIELSTNAGSTWTTVAASYSNASSSVNYPWNVPNTPSTQCLVRVTDNSNPFNTDTSDSLFTISPSIVVTYPNYGATIQSGSTVPISWINYNASNFYTIDYSTDGGSTWTNIVTSFNTTGSTYNWVNVPATLSTNCRIRITDATASCKQDISDVPFTIQSTAPAITITAPNGGEILTGCGTYTIAWNATGTSTLFNLEYSSDAGFTWNTIVTNYNTATNNYVWTVPNISALNCLVRVTDATAATKTDISNQVFRINAAAPATISPAGPLAICAGASLTLTSSSATGNLWSTGATSQAITVSAAGNYTVTVTNAGCASTSNTVAVTVNPQPATPTITASGPTTFCAGGSITLTSSSATGNLWLPGNQTSSQILVTSSGSYSVVVTNANGCSATSNPTVVTVNPLPGTPTAGSNSPVATGTAINLTATTVSGATYAWTGPNSFSSTSQNPTISGATNAMAGTYSVMAIANGCSSAVSTTLVNVVPGAPTSTISGTIKHPNLVSFIPGVTVDLTGASTGSMVTAANGQYTLTANTGGNYTVTPSKANDVTTNNGVTTLDLVLMQRHILQQDTLDSPYQIIAADVNNSGSVTTLDIVLTRTVILQTSLTFPSGRLWAMVDASYVFPSTYTPFPFPSTRTYASAGNAANQDFYGVKLGDVNWSWNPSIAKVDYTGELGFNFGKAKGRVGEVVTVPVRVSDFNKIAGYQYTLEWDGSVIEYVGIEGGAHLPSVGDARASEGVLTLSWNDERGDVVTLADGTVAFNLQFRVVGQSGMSAQLKATSSVVNGEAYDEQLSHLSIVSREGGFEVVGDAGAMGSGEELSVIQNFPNPFSKETTVRFEVAETKQVRFVVSDLGGRVVLTANGVYDAGVHEWKWNGKSEGGRDLPSGTYLLRIQAGETTKTIRVVYTPE